MALVNATPLPFPAVTSSQNHGVTTQFAPRDGARSASGSPVLTQLAPSIEWLVAHNLQLANVLYFMQDDK